MEQLSAADRATYAKTGPQRASKPLPKPMPKRAVGLPPAERERAERQYQGALEAWEVGCLNRRIKAAQKRKERMEKKCRG